jgi:16S rRNA (uracil1498-N3)-methyltransferase
MITFFANAELNSGAEVELDESAVAHARAKRVSPGDAARLLDGKGSIAQGIISALGKRTLAIQVQKITRVPRPMQLEVIVPVADRDRMLVAAEKCAELQVTAWRPAVFARSRSVTPRGEGPKFREKVEARMRSALEQSGGAWMPDVFDEAELDEALVAVWLEKKLVLDSSGTSIAQHISKIPMALLIGPEGGIEPDELQRVRAAGWVPVAVADTILRFETAIITSVGAVRALQIGG